jgi:hypothetical protein
MKRLVLGVLALLIAVPCYAHSYEPSNKEHNVLGGKIRAPKLVGITKNISLGVEGGKEVVKNIGYDPDYFEGDRGWFGFITFTYDGCWFNCK